MYISQISLMDGSLCLPNKKESVLFPIKSVGFTVCTSTCTQLHSSVSRIGSRTLSFSYIRTLVNNYVYVYTYRIVHQVSTWHRMYLACSCPKKPNIIRRSLFCSDFKRLSTSVVSKLAVNLKEMENLTSSFPMKNDW